MLSYFSIIRLFGRLQSMLSYFSIIRLFGG